VDFSGSNVCRLLMARHAAAPMRHPAAGHPL